MEVKLWKLCQFDASLSQFETVLNKFEASLIQFESSFNYFEASLSQCVALLIQWTLYSVSGVVQLSLHSYVDG